MTDPTINYAQGGGLNPASPSWLGRAAYVFRHPIPGPAGGVVRDVIAPIFAVVVLLLWIGGVSLAIVAGRRRGFSVMPSAALAMAGAAVALLGLMVLLQY